jgi:hypothetical protein
MRALHESLPFQNFYNDFFNRRCGALIPILGDKGWVTARLL